MTALERYEHKNTLESRDTMENAWSLAQRICNTEFVPKGLRGSAEKVLAALLLGQEKGIGAMTALQHIDVIEGKAVSNSELKQALAQSSGARIRVMESSATRCVIHAWPAGEGGEPTVVTWTIEDAKQAGLTGKDNWRKYPKRMLFRRASADATAMVAAAAIVGIPPSVDEIEDDAYIAAQTTPEAATRRTVARRRPEPAAEPPAAHTAAAEPLPSFDDDVTEAEIVEDTPPRRGVTHNWDRPTDTSETSDPDTATTKQINKLSILFNRQGWDEDTIDAYLTNLTAGRTTSRKDLTKQEASNAIEELEAAS